MEALRAEISELKAEVKNSERLLQEATRALVRKSRMEKATFEILRYSSIAAILLFTCWYYTR